jgi:hydroxyacylglutathione hydrolase
MSVEIVGIPAFSDNYIWLMHDGTRGVVVDPGDAAPVQAALEERNLELAGILVTHHHFDHTGGVLALKDYRDCPVWGPHNPKIEGIDHRVSEGDQVSLLGAELSVIEVPGHTLDHIAYIGPDWVFCGDTLFAGGCGRVFEGTFPMMRASLQRLRQLPEATRVFCAHEYTTANLAFAVAADPDNSALQGRVKTCQDLRAQNQPTVPSTIGEEIATNPFLRWDAQSLTARLARAGGDTNADPDFVFAKLRQWKDNF